MTLQLNMFPSDFLVDDKTAKLAQFEGGKKKGGVEGEERTPRTLNTAQFSAKDRLSAEFLSFLLLSEAPCKVEL